MSNQDTKRPRWIAAAIVAGLLVIGIVVLRPWPVEPQSPAEAEPPTQEALAASANTTLVAAAPVVAANLAFLPAPPAAVTLASGGGGSAALLRIQDGEVLATVNGTPIELKDLLPLPPENTDTDYVMWAERYDFLLDRAVDREVTLQNACAQHVDLTELQREQLAKFAARSEQMPANVFEDQQHSPAHAEFAARDATALLLQAALAEKAGVPSRDVSAAQVDHYFQEHRAEYAALPADAAGRQVAWASIDQDIRVKLAAQAQTLHDESFQKFFNQLRASAQITLRK